MPALNEQNRLGDVLKYEAPNLYSRYEGVVAKGEQLSLGQLVAQRSFDKIEIKPQESNTGNGEVKDVMLGRSIRSGTYHLIAESKDAFAITTPNGTLLPPLKVGAPYISPHLSLTVNAGTAEFVAGDIFLIVISGSHKIAAYNPLALDGTQIPVGIVITDIDATEKDTKAVIINNHATFSDKGIIWPKDITEPLKRDAIDHLFKRGLLIRKGV